MARPRRDAFAEPVPDADLGRLATSATSPAASLAALAAREQQAVAALESDLTAVDGPLARLLASVAACRSVHVTLLEQLADQARRKQGS